MRTPQRGEVWLVDLGMTAKVRPALVLSIPVEDADRALVTVVPHTTSVRGSRFEAAVPVGFLKTGAFDAQSLVTIPHARLLHVLGKLMRGSWPWSRQRCGLGSGLTAPGSNPYQPSPRQVRRTSSSGRARKSKRGR